MTAGGPPAADQPADPPAADPPASDPPAPGPPAAGAPQPAVATPESSPSRPLIERVGLGAIALVLAGVFAAVALAAFASGEVFLGTMAGIGALMTVWAGAATLRR